MKMRFPYFYQLMFGFLTVILTLMAITAFSILHFGRTQLLNEVEAEYFHYAELIEVAEQKADEEKLDAYEEILANQDIGYGIFNPEGQLEYPKTSQDIQMNLEDGELEKLQAGENLVLDRHVHALKGEKKEFAAIYIPTFDDEHNYTGFIGVGSSAQQIESAIKATRWNVFKAFLLSTVIAIVVSLIFSYFMVKRINRLSKASRKVATGDYDIYIDHSNRDEIDRLSADFNKMIKALKEWRREVLHLEERRKTFMQDAIHEMRTPLTTINGLLEGLKHGIFDEKQEMRSIEIMSKETTRLIRLVNENLDYENIQANKIVLKKSHFPLVEAMEEIRQQLSTLADEANNEIKIESDVSGIYVYADFDRFKQIIVNLLKNAMQFSDGVIKVDASETQDFTYVTVSDNGIGMTTEELENIWERYYKADPSRKNTKYGESGLGLPIVKQLIELHDGFVEVESERGQGTTFKLAFPQKSTN